MSKRFMMWNTMLFKEVVKTAIVNPFVEGTISVFRQPSFTHSKTKKRIVI